MNSVAGKRQDPNVDTSAPIAIIPKTTIDEIRVMWSEYKGHRYLDIRVYTEIDGKTDKVPTKRALPCGRT